MKKRSRSKKKKKKDGRIITMPYPYVSDLLTWPFIAPIIIISQSDRKKYDDSFLDQQSQ